MILPNFLGLGVQRAGTTWLDRILRTHPLFYLPVKRKEVHFFDCHYQKGKTWYASFFPDETIARRYSWLGEITPDYIYQPEALERIRDVLPAIRIIVLLRNPVDRAYSEFRKACRDLNLRESFQIYLHKNPGVFERGLYGAQVSRLLTLFDHNQCLFLVFEEIMRDPETGLREIGNFFSVDPAGFDRTAVTKKVNASMVPRFPALYRIVSLCRGRLRSGDIHWMVNLGKTLKIRELFSSNKQFPALDSAHRESLLQEYRNDIMDLERIVGKPFSHLWLGRNDER